MTLLRAWFGSGSVVVFYVVITKTQVFTVKSYGVLYLVVMVMSTRDAPAFVFCFFGGESL